MRHFSSQRHARTLASTCVSSLSSEYALYLTKDTLGFMDPGGMETPRPPPLPPPMARSRRRTGSARGRPFGPEIKRKSTGPASVRRSTRTNCPVCSRSAHSPRVPYAATSNHPSTLAGRCCADDANSASTPFGETFPKKASSLTAACEKKGFGHG
jgi:hypothetical protein